MSTFTLTVVSPEGNLFSGDATYVNLPTDSGEITVLPHHTPLVTIIRAGALRIGHGKESEEILFIGGGALEFRSDNTCRILGDTAERAHGIDIEAAREAKARAENAVNQAEGEKAVAEAQAALFLALQKIQIAERYKKR